MAPMSFAQNCSFAGAEMRPADTLAAVGRGGGAGSGGFSGAAQYRAEASRRRASRARGCSTPSSSSTPTTTRRTSSRAPSAFGSAPISRSRPRSYWPSSSAANASLRSGTGGCAPAFAADSSPIRAARPSAAKLPGTRASTASASSVSPRSLRILASGTAASARVGSSSCARRSDASSPRSTSPSASEGSSPSRNCSTAAGGCAPTNSATTRPSRNALTAGIPWIRNARARPGLASVSILASSSLPARAATARSSTGVSCRQGPHQAAQKSTTTGTLCERSRTAVWNVLSVTSMSLMVASGFARPGASSCRPDMAEIVVRTDGVELAGDEAGEGIPVVLLHGLTATRRYVVMGSRALERSGHRVIAYDARGHGRSDPAEPYDYPALASDLERVLDERGIDRAVLSGASMGAHTLLRFALDHPERARALVVITPAYDPGDFPGDLVRWDALADGLERGGVEGFVEAYGPITGPWAQTTEKVLRQRLSLHEHPGAVAQALRQVPRSRPFDALDELAALSMPVTI